MPLRLDIRRQLSARSDRVKSVDLHKLTSKMTIDVITSAMMSECFDTLTQENVPLLDAIGGAGVYVLGLFRGEAEAEAVSRDIEQFR